VPIPASSSAPSTSAWNAEQTKGAASAALFVCSALDAVVEGAPDDAGIGTLGVADDRGFVDLLVRQADFVCGESLPVRKSFRAPGGNLAAVLCGVYK